MKMWSRALVLGGALALAAGCEGVKQDLGIGGKRPPDEFSVYSRAPLSLPPDYGLRPPAGATAASESAAPRETARQAIMGGPAVATSSVNVSSGGSPGVQALLDRTGAAKAQADIRSQVNRETTILADADQSFVERLMFWSNTPPNTTVVDASQEARRLQQNQALNQPLTAGETPTIRRKPKALLQGIFN